MTCLLVALMLSVPAISLANPGHARNKVFISKTIKGFAQAQQRADGALIAKSRVSGTGNIHAQHVIIEDVLAPGNSPGCISFGGDVTFSVSATMSMEIAGTTPCSGHDQITVANQLTISSATLEVILFGGYVPAYGERFDIIDWGSITGSFGSIDTIAAILPAPLVWDTSQLYLTGELIIGVQQFADGDLAPWNNPDGMINAADVLIAQQLALGLRMPGALQYAHGDMNNDGVIDVTDLILITQTVL